jgi:heptosyltransferase-2
LAPWDALFSADPRIRRIIRHDVRDSHRLRRWHNIWRWLREVAATKYDMIIDFQSTDRSRMLIAMLWLFGGQSPIRAGNMRVYPYNRGPERLQGRQPFFELARDSLASIGVEAKADKPVLHPSPEHEARALEMLEEAGLEPRRFVVFLPGSQAAGYLKRWGAQRYATLGKLIEQTLQQSVVIIGGPDEIEECTRIAEGIGENAVNLCGRTQLLDIPRIAARASVIVANDTGTGHVAACANRPMLVICGPTEPRRVKPAGPRVTTLQADLPCINCYQKTCDHHSCMRSITPELVLGLISERVVDPDRTVIGSVLSPRGANAFAGIRIEQ